MPVDLSQRLASPPPRAKPVEPPPQRRTCGCRHEFPIAREGFPFIAVGIGCTAAGLLVHVVPLVWLGLGWSLCCLLFFRNPPRAIPQGDGVVVSPADGTVIGIHEVMEPNFLHRPMQKLSIFLSVLNVHVNRTPTDGVVVGTRYISGRFHIASKGSASEANERNAVWLRNDAGDEMVMVQVAGKVARRIVCYLKEGDAVTRGERCGIIRFGSRVDLYLEPRCRIVVCVGDRVRGGSTIIARTTEGACPERVEGTVA